MNVQEFLFILFALIFIIVGLGVYFIGHKIEKKRADPSYVKKERKRRYYDFSNAHLIYQPKRKGEGYAWITVAIIWAVFLIKMTVPALITGSLVLIGFGIKDWLLKRKYAAAAARSLTQTMDISVVDGMTGEQFEHWCGNLLIYHGFGNVRYTKTSGDQGVDILAEKNGVKYAIQCKRYNSSVGNSAVQEVLAGMNFYGCQRCAVMTSNYFTQSAIDLAKANHVELCDRNKLIRLLQAAKPPEPVVITVTEDNDDDYLFWFDEFDEWI